MSANTKNQCMYSAFFMEGLRDLDYQAVLDTWGQGCLELVDQMTTQADLLDRLCTNVENALGHSLSFPGIFEYEVCSEFGTWFGKYVINYKTTPSKQNAEAWLRDACYKFFTQGMTGPDDPDLERLRAALL